MISADVSFATTLEICYEILLYLSSRMSKLASGEIFEFITNDPGASEKITAWCEVREFVLLADDMLPDGRHRFLIQK